MSIDFDGSAAGLFPRWGLLGKEYLRVITSIGSALDTSVEAIRDKFETGAQASVLDTIYSQRDSYRTTPAGWLSYLQSVIQSLAIKQTNDDAPLLSQTLSSALTEIIRQMKVGGFYVTAPTVGSTVTPWGSNIGDSKLVVSNTNQYGDQINTIFPEDIRFTCTADAASGATQYREVFTITGEPLKAITAFDWPGGSGATGSLTLTDPDQSGLLADCGFELWSAPAAMAPNWTVVTGTAGTNITRTTSSKRGNYALRLTSDGSTLLTFKQQLSTSLVRPNTVYIFSYWAKIDTLDASGILRTRLVDGSGSVISNDASTANSYTRNLNGNIGTSYTFISTAFQTPRQLPSTGVFLEIGFSTSPANTRTVDIDLIGLVAGQQLYAGGSFVAGFSGATANAAGDYSTVAFTNDAANASWVRAGQRWMQMPSLGPTYYWPTSGSTLINNSLLT